VVSRRRRGRVLKWALGVIFILLGVGLWLGAAVAAFAPDYRFVEIVAAGALVVAGIVLLATLA